MPLSPQSLKLSEGEIKFRDAWIERIDKYLRDNCFGEAIDVPAVSVSEHLDSVPSLRLANAICRRFDEDSQWSSITYGDEHFHFKP